MSFLKSKSAKMFVVTELLPSYCDNEHNNNFDLL